MYNHIINLRKELHKYPELSNKEFNTSKQIKAYIQQYSPDKTIKLGKTGLAFVFNGKSDGKTIIFRTELDALPISENNTTDYSSVYKGIAHSCGHDGHMAIMVGLAEHISKNKIKKGKVILLFQPAEEIEQGAKDIINNPKFKQIKADYIFALHNIPGIEKNTIVNKTGNFASASKGMTIKLYGTKSHAAEPENGINPANAISFIINQLHKLITNKSLFEDLTLLTIINIQLGEKSFGISPGYAEISITLRSHKDNDMQLLTNKTEEIISQIAKSENLRFEISYSEIFPAVVNNNYCVDIINKAAHENNLQVLQIEKPFKWSEDFGYYCKKIKSGYFGLGAGKHQPALHKPEYDFPDDIIETGIKTFKSIITNID